MVSPAAARSFFKALLVVLMGGTHRDGRNQEAATTRADRGRRHCAEEDHALGTLVVETEAADDATAAAEPWTPDACRRTGRRCLLPRTLTHYIDTHSEGRRLYARTNGGRGIAPLDALCGRDGRG